MVIFSKITVESPEKNALYCAFRSDENVVVDFIDQKGDRLLEREYRGFLKKALNSLIFYYNALKQIL